MKNNSMNLDVLAVIKTSATSNVAMLKRLNDNSFIVVSGLQQDYVNDTCDWNFAYAYDLNEKQAQDLLIKKAFS